MNQFPTPRESYYQLRHELRTYRHNKPWQLAIVFEELTIEFSSVVAHKTLKGIQFKDTSNIYLRSSKLKALLRSQQVRNNEKAQSAIGNRIRKQDEAPTGADSSLNVERCQ